MLYLFKFSLFCLHPGTKRFITPLSFVVWGYIWSSHDSASDNIVFITQLLNGRLIFRDSKSFHEKPVLLLYRAILLRLFITSFYIGNINWFCCSVSVYCINIILRYVTCKVQQPSWICIYEALCHYKNHTHRHYQ